MRNASIPNRTSLVHLLALALCISAGCMVGLFVLMRQQWLKPPSRPQNGIVQLRLVQNPAPPSSAPSAPASAGREGAPPRPADMPSPAVERAARPAESRVPGRRERGEAAALALPRPPSEAAFQAPSSETVADFQRQLLDHIAQYRRFPPGARAAHLQGRVLVLFVMNRDGTVRSAVIQQSSGTAIFDDEALDTVRRAQPLPVIPAALADHLKILLPVEFAAP